MTTHLVASHDGVTLGILAGGQATRLGGRDKAWLERDGVPRVMAIAGRFASLVDAVIVSANRDPERYLFHGLRAVHDRTPDIGPLGGLDALAHECKSEWLLTLPVDVLDWPDDLVERLMQLGGAVAEDDDGVQPLVALWNARRLCEATTAAIASNDYAVHALQAGMEMARVRFAGVRFGNLNTPTDLAAAGIDP